MPDSLRRTSRPLAGGLALLAVLLPAACAPPGNYDARFTGQVGPGTGLRCPTPSQGTLTMNTHKRTVTFTPNDGVLVLFGKISPAGHIEARLNTHPNTNHPYILAFTGHRSGNTITGTYESSLCTAPVMLHPANPPARRIFAPDNPLGL